MEAMDKDRLELYDMLKPKLDEEPARRLILALGPHRDQQVTRDYFDAKLDARIAQVVDQLTWRMITVVGAWTVMATSLYAFMSGLFGG